MCKVPVTIGLCVKNCSNTIRDTLKCIIEQDYPSKLIEIIVVDDKSSDDTLSIITKTLSNSSLNFKVFSTKGKGLGFARQLVVSNARGKYIIWVDGDMIIPKNFVTQHVMFMERNPEVGKARAKWGVLKEHSLPAMLECLRLIAFSKTQKKSYLTGIGGSICRTCALRAIGGFDVEIFGACEDIDLALRLAKSWKIATNDAIFYHRFRKTWKELWQQYYWYGYGMHYVCNKHKNAIRIWNYLPHVAFLAGMRQALFVFKLVRLKKAFLLPLQYIFKYSAWLNGYLRSHLDGYEYSAL
jgi:glycosyltransferase involved in cell wall biosynthesis